MPARLAAGKRSRSPVRPLNRQSQGLIPGDWWCCQPNLQWLASQPIQQRRSRNDAGGRGHDEHPEVEPQVEGNPEQHAAQRVDLVVQRIDPAQPLQPLRPDFPASGSFCWCLDFRRMQPSGLVARNLPFS